MSLITLLDKVSTTRVLVIGDLMLDHYIWGDIHRISPEAPVPVVNVIRDSYTAGGAANVALNLANLSVGTHVLGYYSKDEAGDRLQEILKTSKIVVSGPILESNAPTIIKTRVIVRGQQLCRIDREAFRDGYCIDSDPAFKDQLDVILKDVQAVIISDYAKGVITQAVVDQIIQASLKRSDLLVAVDPKPSRKLNYKGVGLLTPNRQEALELAGFGALHPEEKYPLEEICKRIHELCAPRLLIITLGADGMAICKEGKVVEHLPTQAREVFDVSGAGDTVIATLTAALAAGADVVDAAKLANAAAGCVVAHMGTAPVQKEELYNWLRQFNQ